MAKLAVVAAVLVAFLALAEASSYRVITTFEEDNQGQQRQGSQQCMQQIQQQWQQLENCRQYLSRRSSYATAMKPQESQDFQQCCQALQNFNEEDCRCQALSQVMRQQQGGGSSRGQGQQGQSLREMMMKARFLPFMCSLGHECYFMPSSF